MATEIRLRTVPISGRWSSILDVAIAGFLEAREEFKANEGIATLPDYIEAVSILGAALEEEFSDVDGSRCDSALHWVKVALGDLQDGVEPN